MPMSKHSLQYWIMEDSVVIEGAYIVLVLLLTAQTSFVDCAKFDHNVIDSPGCTKEAIKCSLEPWIIEKKETMILYNDTTNKGYPLFLKNKTINKRTTCTKQESFDPSNSRSDESVLVGDGTNKYVYTINGMMPGPSIVVYEGTEVEVKVTNKLHQETIGIHWHGIHQRGRPWMDGVPGISHCGIHPEESFVYRFIAQPVGTHWYHSHLGFQRSDGLFGALIVKPKNQMGEPSTSSDFIMMVNDWYPGSGHHNFVSFYHFLNVFQWNPNGYMDLNETFCAVTSQQEDRSEVGTIPFFSALLNGKGRRARNAEEILNTEKSISLFGEVFKMDYNLPARFRVINAGLNYPLRIAVDQHNLQLFSSDGQKLKINAENDDGIVDDIIIHTGERYDFLVNPNYLRENTGKNYWIRVEPVYSYIEKDKETVSYPVGVLSYYEDGGLDWPNTMPKDCSADRKCKTLNCPFRGYRESKDRQCINIDDLISTELTDDDKENLDSDNIQEKLFVLHFPYAIDTQRRSAINGIQFVLPSFPPHASAKPYSDGMKFDEDCDTKCGPNIGERPCECTHTVDISTGKMIQFVFLNKILTPDNIEATAHPIHLHGHSFYVVKVGYPVYDNGTKRFKSMNSDLKCMDEDTIVENQAANRCNEIQWAKGTWEATIGEDINLVNPPVKDTLTVPPGGYVVIRFKADNPGWWLLHCHIELHLAEGMGFMVKEGSSKEMPQPPQFFPKCGSFDWSQPQQEEDGKATTTGSIAVYVVIAVLSLVLLLMLIYILKTWRRRHYNDINGNLGLDRRNLTSSSKDDSTV